MNSVNLDLAGGLASGLFDICRFKSKTAWSIIVNNRDAAPGVLTFKSLAIEGVKFNVEILVGLPLVIVFDLNF